VNAAMNSKPDASPLQRTSLYACFLVVIILFGFVPVKETIRSYSGVSPTEQRLYLARIESNLSTAAIDVRRGDYTQARKAASDFFADLRSEVARGDESVLSRRQREGLQSIETLRDDILTRLARGEPASADRLAELYVSYRNIMMRDAVTLW
jgi:hypothetical protein